MEGKPKRGVRWWLREALWTTLGLDLWDLYVEGYATTKTSMLTIAPAKDWERAGFVCVVGLVAWVMSAPRQDVILYAAGTLAVFYLNRAYLRARAARRMDARVEADGAPVVPVSRDAHDAVTQAERIAADAAARR